MQQENHVSIWLGNFVSEESLMEYVQIKYDEDGNSVSPPFMVDFNLSHWEEGCREAIFIAPPSNDVSTLLSGISYAESIIPQIIKTTGTHINQMCNSAVLLYNYHHTSTPSNKPRHLSELRFVDSIQFQHP